MPKPFVKWAGGKQGLSTKLVNYFPSFVRKFYEPFIGGGSVFFTIMPKSSVVGDLNTWLIDTYEAIRDDWKVVADELDKLPNTKEDFLRIRKIKPQSLSLQKRAAQFIYLNKTCFRGLYRVNRLNEFNVPYGTYNRRYYDPQNLAEVSEALKHTEFRRCDFELCLNDITKEDFVYFDPPYYKLGGYADFNRYTSDQFRDLDHIRLATLCKSLDSCGIKWAVSNSNTDFVRKIFDGFLLHEVTNRREIKLNSQERKIVELLITNYPIQKQDVFSFVKIV
jgi:DNA adenine methylase